MMNFREKISRWMYGRYGFDKLSYALFIAYCVVVGVNIFVGSGILYAVSMAIIAYVFFRLISKNPTRRRMENEVFEKYYNKIKPVLMLEKRRIVEIRTHRFRKCPNCKTVMRLKRQTGQHTVVCPRCHQETKIRIWF